MASRSAMQAPVEEADSGLSTLLAAVAAVSVAMAIQAANGNLEPSALVAVTVAILAILAGLVVPRFTHRLDRVPEGAAVAVLGLGLLWQFDRLVTSPPGMYLRLAPGLSYAQFLSGLV